MKVIIEKEAGKILPRRDKLSVKPETYLSQRDILSVEKKLFIHPYRAVRYGLSYSTMADTYTQIHIQTVFAVQNRQSLIRDNWKNELYKYITTIIQNEGHKVLQINGMPDHVHIFFGMRPIQSLSDLMKRVKGRSSAWINKNGFTPTRFSWQEGYGAFSYAKSQVPQVIRYIQNQEEHHRKKTFIEEYVDFLKAFDIEYDEQYVFKPVL